MYTLSEHYDNLSSKITAIDALELKCESKARVAEIIKKIKEDDFENNYIRGKALEELIVQILRGMKIFKTIKYNINTSSNEFDVIAILNILGKDLRDRKIIPEWIPDTIIFECKNYSGHVKVDYIGKFFSLMESSKINLGIFVSRVGVTGKYDNNGNESKYWKDAMSFINKINLKYSEAQNAKILLDIELKDLENLMEDGNNIIDILEIRKIQIDCDINKDISSWIIKHDNEGKLGL